MPLCAGLRACVCVAANYGQQKKIVAVVVVAILANLA